MKVKRASPPFDLTGDPDLSMICFSYFILTLFCKAWYILQAKNYFMGYNRKNELKGS